MHLARHAAGSDRFDRQDLVAAVQGGHRFTVRRQADRTGSSHTTPMAVGRAPGLIVDVGPGPIRRLADVALGPAGAKCRQLRDLGGLPGQGHAKPTLAVLPAQHDGDFRVRQPMDAAQPFDVFSNDMDRRIPLAQSPLGGAAIDPRELGAIRRELRLIAVADQDAFRRRKFRQVDAPVRVVDERAVADFVTQPLEIGRTALGVRVRQAPKSRPRRKPP